MAMRCASANCGSGAGLSDRVDSVADGRCSVIVGTVAVPNPTLPSSTAQVDPEATSALLMPRQSHGHRTVLLALKAAGIGTFVSVSLWLNVGARMVMSDTSPTACRRLANLPVLDSASLVRVAAQGPAARTKPHARAELAAEKRKMCLNEGTEEQISKCLLLQTRVRRWVARSQLLQRTCRSAL